ncbi:MAG: ATP-binding cassette domain-containing protein [Caenispirillum bisanense]|nr:ATP-binding cassette domain-containing protein [Caenispirillum bisanense]MCA1972842.1 ATP-binding cassette domain-containing protein [Caenispirillum sp.]
MSKGSSAQARWGGWRRFSGVGKAAFPLAIGTIFLNLLGLVLPLSLLQVYDRIIPNSSTGTLTLIVLGVLFAMVLEVILRGARTAITGWLAARFEHNAGMAAFDRVLGAPVHEVEREGAGGLLERMSAIYSLKEHYADQGIAVFLDLPFVFLFLGLIWLLGGDLVWVPTAVLVLFSVMMLWHGRQLRRSIRTYNEVRDRRLSFNIEILSGIHAVKSQAMEGQMTQRYVRLQEAVARADHDVVLRNASAQTLGNMFSQMVMVATVALGSVYVVNNLMTVGGLAACTLLAGRAVQPVQRAVAMWTRMQTVSLARERASGLFGLPVAARPAAPYIAPLAGKLELQDVSFTYGKDAPVLFDGVSLTIEPGECVGITGTNGCGKSSLLRLMAGSLQPTAGRVLLDGVPLTDWAPEALEQGGIGILPSEAFLFRGTLLDNLTMFRRELRERALQAASDLGLDDVVATFPNGYLTTIAGGAADAMPRGIRQRIAIARVLALDPRVILFDEANTAMDGPGDEALRAHLESLKGDRTLVMVSLRPSLLKLADRRFEIVGARLDAREDPSLTGRFGAGAPSVRRSSGGEGAVAQ